MIFTAAIITEHNLYVNDIMMTLTLLMLTAEYTMIHAKINLNLIHPQITLSLTLWRSNLNPYCMGRKAAFFQWAFKCMYIPVRLAWQATFKSSTFWYVSAGKGLNKDSAENIMHQIHIN
jgi:hypothetical protein